MKPFTFDQIPVMMNKLHDKLEHLEKLILRISITEENKDELLNVAEASKLLDLSVATIYSKICKLNTLKFGTIEKGDILL